MGKLFGTNGVRLEFTKGNYDPGFLVKLAGAVATYVNAGDVLLGFDVRVTSLPLVGVLYGVLSMYGINVDVIGPLPTPIHQYLTKAWGYRAGIMVTASHNPPHYNGIKLMDSNGVEVSRRVEEEVETIFFNGRYKETVDYRDIGAVRFINVEEGLRDYRDHLLSIINDEPIRRRGFRIVADFANSVNSIALSYVLRGLNVKVYSINGHLDGEFPGRNPEPRPENLNVASRAVVESSADFGVAYDGDGDRSLFIDEKGNVIWGDRTGTILALSMIKNGDKVVTPVSSSVVVKWAVEGAGGRVIWTRVGSVDVSHKVIEEGALCGFEDNGGFIWPKHHPVRDGVSTTLLMMKVLSEEKAKLSELNARMPAMLTARERMEMSRDLAGKIVEALKGRNWGGEVITIDGLRVNYTDSWFLVRPSGTENLLRVVIEASSSDRFNTLRHEVMNSIEKELKKYSGVTSNTE
ncbi:phosphoglucosamine mutase [Caldivirga maquilingensis]|uniref:phosphoglucosamine mutase n=1 Tax=Caldivirga maquilingensis TaxID=76887 RepID=UPI00064F3FFC|nr:phosphoglucosamine mutase [Caldivirga maquilingensis]